MTVLLPVLKQTRKGKDENGKEIDAIVRHDSAVMLNLISQYVNYNEGKYKKLLKTGTKLMKAFRKWNFDHEDQTGEVKGEISVTEEQLDHLYDILVKDRPDKMEIRGVMSGETLTDFEDFYDERKAKQKESEKSNESNKENDDKAPK